MRARFFDRGAKDRGFAKNNSGQTAILFALSLVPMLAIVGFGVDYGRSLKIQAELNSDADAAALSAVSNSTSRSTPPTNAQIATYFNASLGPLPEGVSYSVDATTVTTGTKISATVKYTAKVPTLFGKLYGLPQITVSGSSTSEGQLPTYIDFYLLLDNSPSMGIGATAADIQSLQSLTPDSCAFACHQHSFDALKRITGDNTGDYYHIAKNNGVTTRIDVLRTATQSLMKTAQSTETIPSQFRMAVYTFSDTFQTIAGLSSNLTTVGSQAGAIDLAYAYQDQRDTQTSYDTALHYVGNTMPAFAGTGTTAAQPQSFVFFVTDGVVDEPTGMKSGIGDTSDVLVGGLPSVLPNTLANVPNNLLGNVSSTRLIQTMDDTMCNSIKTRGIKIAVLYTTYLPVVNNAFYNQWVAPISSSIPTQLQNCASPGFFFQISPTQGISQAMQAMFNAAVSNARLTR